jgi:hypothetical protein
MSAIFAFGERLDGYAVPVLNERAVRAAAGIVFFFAIVSFMNAWLVGNFQPTRVFVVAFLIDFTIRIFVNPRFAPSLILGQWMVRKQQPEWVGAPQKRFAWAIGFVLALVMLYLVVIKHVIGPINLIVCAACLVLLFFETAFGICIGCKVYNGSTRTRRSCAPAVCANSSPRAAPAATGCMPGWCWPSSAVIGAWTRHVIGQRSLRQGRRPGCRGGRALPPLDATEAERCKVPDFAKAMGHEEKWKLHNNCR